MSGDDEQREHMPSVDGDLTLAQVRHSQYVEAVAQHMTAAREAAGVLIARARALVRNGVDFRHPERAADFVDDQVMDAVRQATMHECACSGAQGAAAVALLAEVSAALALQMEGRES